MKKYTIAYKVNSGSADEIIKTAIVYAVTIKEAFQKTEMILELKRDHCDYLPGFMVVSSVSELPAPTTPQPQLPEELIEYRQIADLDVVALENRKAINALIRYLKSLPVTTTKE